MAVVNMQRLLLVAALIAAVTCEQATEEDLKFHEECVKELGYNITFSKNMSEEEMKQLYCMMSCVEIKKGTIDDEGNLNIEKVKARPNMVPKVAKTAVEMCNNVTASDKCELIANKLQCLVSELNNPTPTEEERRIRKECEDELGYTVDPNPNGFKGQEDKVHCLVKCLTQKTGTIDDEGELVAEKMSEVTELDKEVAERAAKECKEVTDENVCTKAHKKITCFWEKALS